MPFSAHRKAAGKPRAIICSRLASSIGRRQSLFAWISGFHAADITRGFDRKASAYTGGCRGGAWDSATLGRLSVGDRLVDVRDTVTPA